MKKKLIKRIAFLIASSFTLTLFSSGLSSNAVQVTDYSWSLTPSYAFSGQPFQEGRSTTSLRDGTQFPRITLLDRAGNEYPILSKEGDDLSDFIMKISSFSEGYAVATFREPWGSSGIIDRNGQIIFYSEERSPIGTFSNGLIPFQDSNGKMGYMDPYGIVEIPAHFYQANNFSDGLALIQEQEGGPYGYINTEGELTIPPSFSDANNFSEGYAAVQLDTNHAAFIDRSGTVVIDHNYTAADSFSEGYAFAYKITEIPGENQEEIQTEQQMILVDYQGSETELSSVVPFGGPQLAGPFCEGVAVVRGSNGKYGTINTRGEQIIPFVFDQLRDCSEGLHWYERDGQFGFCDQTGASILEGPEFQGFLSSEGLISASVKDSLNKLSTGYLQNPITILSPWAENEFYTAYDYSIVPNELRTFPNMPITRRQFSQLAVKVIEKLTGRELTPAALDTFSDTMDYDVRKLYDLHIIDGMDIGIFEPDGILTREQAAKIIALILDYAGATPNELQCPNYPDEDRIADYAKQPVCILYTTGLMLGTDTGFSPQDTLTKEQSVATMVRLLDYISSEIN